MSDLDLLRNVADQLIPPSFDAVKDAARRRNRRSTTIVALSGIAAATILAGGALLWFDGGQSTTPAPATPTGDRELTYAVGATLHLGDQVVTAPGTVAEIDVTDSGAVFRTDDGGIWFTDGTDVDQLGSMGSANPLIEEQDTPIFIQPGDVVSGSTGSLAGWFEYPSPGQVELVVYDTLRSEEVARRPVDVADGDVVILHSVTQTAAYWFRNPSLDEDYYPDVRIDLATGEQRRITTDEYLAEAQPAGSPRTLLVGHPEGQEAPPYQVFQEGTWQLDLLGPPANRRLEPQGEQPLDLRDGLTNSSFIFTAPDNYPQTRTWLFQWLDDDTPLLMVDDGEGRRGDVLECHVTTKACTVLATLDADAVVPDFG